MMPPKVVSIPPIRIPIIHFIEVSSLATLFSNLVILFSSPATLFSSPVILFSSPATLFSSPVILFSSPAISCFNSPMSSLVANPLLPLITSASLDGFVLANRCFF